MILFLLACNGFSICTKSSDADATVYTYDQNGSTLGIESLRWDTLDDGGDASCESSSSGGTCSTWLIEGAPNDEITFTATLNGSTASTTAEFEFDEECPPNVDSLDLNFNFNGSDTGG